MQEYIVGNVRLMGSTVPVMVVVPVLALSGKH